ncbi:ester cyclase [Arthrobacter sp. CDRTa11]|uniref:ester cyclase n=1 Tax=Arthrobacter sp. CDRTa11 TaxID=2651199 RepID=UPI002265A874|nr:ester cyclase [Arthrobacter sp. CDRTa11]UZX02893.1 ester cyclase [Arthrobacter sp. CDRTa11]
MGLEENKKLVSSFYGALKRKDLAAATGMCHEDFVFYNQIDTPRNGIEGFLASEQKNLDAFEGYSMEIETIAEGDNVVAYIVFEGNQSREIFGITPKGAHLRMSMCNLFRIKNGKFIEKRAHFDRLDHMEQLNKGS